MRQCVVVSVRSFALSAGIHAAVNDSKQRLYSNPCSHTYQSVHRGINADVINMVWSFVQ